MTHERITVLPEDGWRKSSANSDNDHSHAIYGLGQRQNATPGEVAIAWTLLNRAVTGAIVGIRSAEQARGIAGAASLQLTAADLMDIGQALLMTKLNTGRISPHGSL